VKTVARGNIEELVHVKHIWMLEYRIGVCIASSLKWQAMNQTTGHRFPERE